MKRITVWLTATAVVLLIATIAGHEVTYRGTVAAVEPNPYAAADGVLARGYGEATAR